MTGSNVQSLSIDGYLSDKAEHATGLRLMAVSPLAYHHHELYGKPDADALRVGRAAHAATLEPERFLADYVVWDAVTDSGAPAPRRGKRWDEFRAQNLGRTILTAAQHATAVAISDAVRAYPRAAELLSAPGEAELSLRWVHERTGLPCKARLDWLTAGALVELKTARDNSPRMFGAAAARLSYPLQAAFYADGLRACGIEPPPVKIITISSSEPHDVVVYSVPDEVLAIGRDQYERALDQVVACRASGEWPGIARGEELELKLPVWALPDEGWEVGVAAADRVFFGEA